jgi:hypothetical protein
MVSRVFFELVRDGEPVGSFYADLKQTVGSSYETGSIEVGPPITPDGTIYDGPFSHQKFAEATEAYFRGLVGSEGSGIRIEGGSSNIRMMNNVFEQPWSVIFEVADRGDTG